MSKGYTLTLILQNEQGSAKVTYLEVSRESLEEKEQTAALLRLHDATIRSEPEEPAE